MVRRGGQRAAVAMLAVLTAVTACSTSSPSPSTAASSEPSGAAPSGSVPAADLEISQALRDAVEPDAIQAHLDELFAAAQAGDGTRASGTDGYTGSQAYVAETLTDAGFEVTIDEFTFPYFNELSPPSVTVVGGPTFTGGDHLRALIFSRSGEFEAPIVAVAIDDDGMPIGSGGCDESDWDDFPVGSIALAGPAPCFRRQMVDAAQTAGAAALIISSPNYAPGTVRRPTLLDPSGIEIPALYASSEVGTALREAAAAGGSVQLFVETLIQDRVTANVLAERPGTEPDEVVMLGGHLDSVIDGPGINDNGSGTATILEIALQLAEMDPTRRTIRVAFWAVEELGLYGSYNWIQSQDPEDLQQVVAYLNLDMVGSPNFVRQVYDSTSAVFDSHEITDAFGAYFDAVGLAWEPEDLGQGSDHAAFDDFGIPTGGLFSGASELKSDEQAELFGGVADKSMDPCYHLSCDTPDQVSATALDELSDAAAHVLMLLLEGELLVVLEES
ncbi:MAG TPA: M20/M25/M40 family metallo-hydrolase [Candidatus Limnocylindria bacterium]